MEVVQYDEINDFMRETIQLLTYSKLLLSFESIFNQQYFNRCDNKLHNEISSVNNFDSIPFDPLVVQVPTFCLITAKMILYQTVNQSFIFNLTVIVGNF